MFIICLNFFIWCYISEQDWMFRVAKSYLQNIDLQSLIEWVAKVHLDLQVGWSHELRPCLYENIQEELFIFIMCQSELWRVT